MIRNAALPADLCCTQNHAVCKNVQFPRSRSSQSRRDVLSNGGIVIFTLTMKDIHRNDNEKDRVMTYVSMWITLWKRWIYWHKINLNRQLFQLERRMDLRE